MHKPERRRSPEYSRTDDMLGRVVCVAFFVLVVLAAAGVL